MAGRLAEICKWKIVSIEAGTTPPLYSEVSTRLGLFYGNFELRRPYRLQIRGEGVKRTDGQWENDGRTDKFVSE